MKFEHNGKEFNIPNKEVLHLKTTMGITTKEACILWLEDEGKIINQEQKELDDKAKKVKIDYGAMSQKVIDKKMADKPKASKPKTTKENPTKERIIAEMANTLTQMGAENVEITNKAKIIEFTIDGNNYKLDLTQKRKPKE